MDVPVGTAGHISTVVKIAIQANADLAMMEVVTVVATVP